VGRTLGRPSWLPVPDFAIQALLGEGATVVLQGQKVAPSAALKAGYKFKYETIDEAFQNILKKRWMNQLGIQKKCSSRVRANCELARRSATPFRVRRQRFGWRSPTSGAPSSHVPTISGIAVNPDQCSSRDWTTSGGICVNTS